MDPEHLIGASVAFSIQHSAFSIRTDALLFGESASRVVITCEPYQRGQLEALARKHRVPCTGRGKVGGRRLVIPPWIGVSVEELNRAWRGAFVN
jgi:phosphoribosylformylglycinamidine synthase